MLIFSCEDLQIEHVEWRVGRHIPQFRHGKTVEGGMHYIGPANRDVAMSVLKSCHTTAISAVSSLHACNTGRGRSLQRVEAVNLRGFVLDCVVIPQEALKAFQTVVSRYLRLPQSDFLFGDSVNVAC